MQLEKANIRWFLSINYDVIPEAEKQAGKRTYRSISVDGESLEFSEGFTDLHTVSYDAILSGKGYRVGERHQSS